MDVTLVTTGHDVADARLHRHVAALTGAGLTVEVLGLGEVADGPPGAITRTWPRGSLVGRAWRAVLLPWRARGSLLIALDPDVTAGAVLRRSLARRHPMRVVADVHEDYRLLLRDRRWARGPLGLAGRFWVSVGRWAATRADAVVVADAALLPDVPDRVVLPNLPDPAMLPTLTARDREPRALYIGDLRRSRGLFDMLDAVAAAPRWHLDLVGPIAAADLSGAEARMMSPDLRGRVTWYGRLPPREAWEHARGAWVGLLLLEETPAFRGTMPSKVYEYLACGLPVVATRLPRVVQLLTTAGAGTLVQDSGEVAALLRKWSRDPSALDPLVAGARRAAVVAGERNGLVSACRGLLEQDRRGTPESG